MEFLDVRVAPFCWSHVCTPSNHAARREGLRPWGRLPLLSYLHVHALAHHTPGVMLLGQQYTLNEIYGI